MRHVCLIFFPSFQPLHTASRFIYGYGLGIRLPTSAVFRVLAWASTSPSQSNGTDVEPPFKRHRDSLSVLRALASCVTPSSEAPDFRLGGDPWLGSMPNTRHFLLAKAKGRMAARLAIRDYFPNDIVAVAKEVPRVDRWLPLQTPDGVLGRVSDGELPASEGMDRLLLLLAPTHAWRLYTDVAPGEPWKDETLHRLLDLLCATNGGAGGAHNHSLLDTVDLSTLPDPGELYFAEEMAVQLDYHCRKALARPIPLEASGSMKVTLPVNMELTATTTGDEATSSTNDSDSDVDESTDSDTGEPAGRCTWQVQGPAEQLFSHMHAKLQTPAGYASIIRGAAKFHHPRRALELLESAANANIGPLNIAVYLAVIRCLYSLPNPEMRPQVEKMLQQISALVSPLPLSVFEAALYCLAESVRQQSESNQPITDHASFALGLFNEMRRSGLEPSLAAMANLLRVLHFVPLDSAKSVEYSLGYSCSDLISTFVSELERRFQAHPPTRFDNWSMDDYTFFPLAMRIASMENNPELGRYIDHLLTGTHDRRFFLATSWIRRKYIQSYCFSQISPSSLNVELQRDPVKLIQRVEKVYRNHWSVIIITGQICNRLITFFQRFFTITNGNLTSTNQTGQYTKRNKAVKSSQLLAYRLLHQMLTDLLDHPRSPTDLRLPEPIKSMIPLVSAEAHYDPNLAAQFSTAVLERLIQIDEKNDMFASRSSKDKNIDRTQSSSALSVKKIALLVHMLFPLLSRIVGQKPIDSASHSIEVRLRRELSQTFSSLCKWIQYALKHGAISWSWTPESLHMLWEYGQSELSIDHFWDALRALLENDLKPADAAEAKKIERALTPLLDDFECQVVEAKLVDKHGFSDSVQHSSCADRRRVLNQLRHLLLEKCTTLSESEANPHRDLAQNHCVDA
ncbi:hypothetical protein FGIG_06488 [Fasciola gigantica]|uniref:Uncharacterized protein n=1 Tax=Fasciola gigantica TaxID=46835 RepID=A0A504YJB4_FASGI|nr:hypothetical protein FGIG_06488 [Fasciola gigantica]